MRDSLWRSRIVAGVQNAIGIETITKNLNCHIVESKGKNSTLPTLPLPQGSAKRSLIDPWFLLLWKMTMYKWVPDILSSAWCYQRRKRHIFLLHQPQYWVMTWETKGGFVSGKRGARAQKETNKRMRLLLIMSIRKPADEPVRWTPHLWIPPLAHWHLYCFGASSTCPDRA